VVPVAFECAEHKVSSGTGLLSEQTPAACDLILGYAEGVEPALRKTQNKDRVCTRSY
jgi:hypothetical protein